MAPLTHDQFFTQLGELFAASKDQDLSEIFLTQKRYTYGTEQSPPSEEVPYPDLHPDKPLPILVHATDGKFKEARAQRVKLATLVQPDELDGFYSRYAEVCKANMTALKPRDRRARKGKARKKKGGAGQTASAVIP